jgi:hypothetical protein
MSTTFENELSPSHKKIKLSTKSDAEEDEAEEDEELAEFQAEFKWFASQEQEDSDDECNLNEEQDSDLNSDAFYENEGPCPEKTDSKPTSRPQVAPADSLAYRVSLGSTKAGMGMYKSAIGPSAIFLRRSYARN